MNDKIIAQYDSLYESSDGVFGGGNPLKQVEVLAGLLPSGSSILDVGGGEGRNALCLAKKGFEMTVIDFSKVAISKLESKAEEEGLEVKTAVSDVLVDRIPYTFDGMIVSFVLHHMDSADAESLIAEAKEKTNNGGVHVIATFSNEGGLYERSKGKGRFYPNEETILDLYSDWNIFESSVSEIKSHARDKEGVRMMNMVIYLIARKPGVSEREQE